MSSDDGRVQSSLRRTQRGEATMDDVTLVSPPVGVYMLQYSAEGLVSAYSNITVIAGYPALIDACLCATCTRRAGDDVCVDTNVYHADNVVSVLDVIVQLRDAGGTAISSQWDQTREVSVLLEFSEFVSNDY